MCRAAAGKDGGKGRKKKGSKAYLYSHLTAKEHAWYLAKQGTHRGPWIVSSASYLVGCSQCLDTFRRLYDWGCCRVEGGPRHASPPYASPRQVV